MKPCMANSVFRSSSTARSSMASTGCFPCSLASLGDGPAFQGFVLGQMHVIDKRLVPAEHPTPDPASPSVCVAGIGDRRLLHIRAVKAGRRAGSASFALRSSSVPIVASFHAGSWSNNPMVSRVNSNSIGMQISTGSTGASRYAFSFHVQLLDARCWVRSDHRRWRSSSPVARWSWPIPAGSPVRALAAHGPSSTRSSHG